MPRPAGPFFCMVRFKETIPVPQMTAAEFAAALRHHGFRVIRAKIEDATGRCPGVRWPAVLRGQSVDHNRTFTNRAPAAVPPCGDLCFVWEGTAESVKAVLDRAGAKVGLGPVPREGGRRKTGSSVYVRDPDGNLLEFMIYP
jgi:catechol 2,3-dioxygenase-like lactoylglutathione lyase family enzyme